MAFPPGTRFGPYEVLDVIGTGGMGEVYRARDPRLRRDVAIKVLRGSATGESWERFRHEARAASALSHPNICAVFDVGEADGQQYLVMELLEGETLHDRNGREALELPVSVAIALQIADALEAAHEKGIVHRDIKSGNVMLSGRHHAKVLDFGLARQASGTTEENLTVNALTVTGMISGTPHYLSPEVLRGEMADSRSDLWAFGVVLYEMLTGRLPFRGATVAEISSSILKDEAVPLPSPVPPALRALVSRCLEKHPERRYQKAAEIREALERIQAPSSSVRTTGRRKWLSTAAVVVVIAVVSGIGWWQTRAPSAQTLSTGGPASANQEANDLFEMGTSLARIQNNIPKGLEAFNRALKLDPRFSEARRAAAFYLVIFQLNGYTNDASQLYRAEEELRLVEKEVPDSVNLPSSLAALYVTLGKKELAPVEKLDRILRNSPNVQTGIWRGVIHLLAEENAQAKAVFESLLKTDANIGAPRQLLGEVLRGEGDLEAAIHHERRVLEVAPGNISAIWTLSTAYLDQGDFAAARALLEEKREMFGNNYLWKHSWALLLAAEGKHDEARQAMDEETLRFADVTFWETSPTADFYALLGENSKALDWLQKAVRNGDERINYFRRNVRLASLRNDPRFQSLIRSVESRRARSQ